MKNVVGYIGAALALLAALFGAGQRWGEMNQKLDMALQRIGELEREGRYMHGSLTLPKGVK